MPLAAPNFADPLFWTIMLGWIASVVLHEFAHGVVAYWGGDYTIRERGGLSLNPLQYIDPVGSLVLPAVFLAMGGIPLPGGVTYIRRDLLRNREWDALTSLAGPAANLLLFVALVMPFHPRLGLIDPAGLGDSQMNAGLIVIATLAMLQVIACIINLIPIPPLDGFQALSVLMPAETRARFSTPSANLFGLVILFMVVLNVPGLFTGIFSATDVILDALGFQDDQVFFLRRAFVYAFTSG